METFFNESECSECHQVFADDSSQCEHLKNRFVNGTGRILRGLTFIGAGVVEVPADKQATNIAIGKAETEMEEIKMFKSFETEDELKKFVSESTSELKASLAAFEAELANSKKEIEALKVESDSLKKSVAEKDASAKLLIDEIEKFKKVDKDRLGEARLAELVSAGYVVADEDKAEVTKNLSEDSEASFNMFKKAILATVAKTKPITAAATVPSSLVETDAKASVDKDKVTKEVDPLDKFLTSVVKKIKEVRE